MSAALLKRYTMGMKISRPFPVLLLLSLIVACVGTRVAWADSLLVLQRGDGLFTAPATGSATARRVGTLLARADGTRDSLTLWAVSPDGRRVAALARTGVTTAGGGMATRPAVVTISELGGRHRKRLFATDTLRDRQGRSVTGLGLGVEAGAFADWEPLGLAWSADGRTLYLSCRPLAAGGTVAAAATFAVDGASGLALVDAQGRWKSIAALAAIDARGGRLVGIAPTLPAVSGAEAPIAAATDLRAGALTLLELADATRAVLKPAAGDLLPSDALALDPSLSPDGVRITFAAPSGLYLMDRKSQTARRLVAGQIVRPRWTTDGKSLLFLLARPTAVSGTASALTPPPVYDLYAVDVPVSLSAPAPPAPLRLVLQGIDWFDVVPD